MLRKEELLIGTIDELNEYFDSLGAVDRNEITKEGQLSFMSGFSPKEVLPTLVGKAVGIVPYFVCTKFNGMDSEIPEIMLEMCNQFVLVNSK